MKARTGQPEWTTSTGLRAQDYQDSTVRTGQSEQDSRDTTAGTGQLGQGSQKRTAGIAWEDLHFCPNNF
jgi:hypothetical protein